MAPEWIRAYRLEIGTHFNPSTFPDGIMFGGRQPARNTPHPIAGYHPDLLRDLIRIVGYILHEKVYEDNKRNYYVKSKDNQGNIIRTEPMTDHPDVRELNASAARKGDSAPSKGNLSERNSKINTFLCAYTAFWITCNSSVNATALAFGDRMTEPQNFMEQEIDQSLDLMSHMKYLRNNEKCAQYLFFKTYILRNKQMIEEAVYNSVLMSAPWHISSGMFKSSKHLKKLNPRTLLRLVYKEGPNRFLENKTIVSWTEVEPDAHGYLSHENIHTFTEVLVFMPAWCHFYVTKPVDARSKFLAHANRGEAAQKIWNVLGHYGMRDHYPMRLNEDTQRTEFVIEPWLTDKQIKENNASRKKIQKQYSAQAKKEYNDWKKEKTAQVARERKKRKLEERKKQRAKGSSKNQKATSTCHTTSLEHDDLGHGA